MLLSGQIYFNILLSVIITLLPCEMMLLPRKNETVEVSASVTLFIPETEVS